MRRIKKIQYYRDRLTVWGIDTITNIPILGNVHPSRVTSRTIGFYLTRRDGPSESSHWPSKVFACKQNKAFVDFPENDENLPVWALLQTKRAWRKAKEDKGNVKQGVEEGPGLSELYLDGFMDIFSQPDDSVNLEANVNVSELHAGRRERADVFADLA